MNRRNLLTILTFISLLQLSYAQAPVNDNCSGAIEISDIAEPALIDVDITGGSNSGPQNQCFSDNDIWYSFVATTESAFFEQPYNTIYNNNLRIELFETCSSANGLVCFDLCKGCGNVAQDLIEGHEYFLKVSVLDQSERGEFTIRASCSTELIGLEVLDCDSSSNLYDIEIEFAYADLANAQSIEVIVESEFRYFPITTSDDTVSITATGFNSDGQNKSLQVILYSPFCSYYQYNAFTAPVACMDPPVNDNCEEASIVDVTQYNELDMSIAAASSYFNPNDNCYDRGPDVWYEFVAGMEDVYIQNIDDETDTRIYYWLYDNCTSAALRECIILNQGQIDILSNLIDGHTYKVKIEVFSGIATKIALYNSNACDLTVEYFGAYNESCPDRNNGSIFFSVNSNNYNLSYILYKDNEFFHEGNGGNNTFQTGPGLYYAKIYAQEDTTCFVEFDSLIVLPGPTLDTDEDGLYDCEDNCIDDINANQEDTDHDDIGDVCDTCPTDFYNDIDGDGICGDIDNCPSTYNPDQDPIACDLSSIADCRTRDSLALVSFLIATRGDQWIHQWDLLQPMTTWYGVIMNEFGCVSELNLFNNKLKGYLPDEIGFLYDLEIVYIGQNAIQGSIPSTIGNLSELRHFNIWRNRLSGDLPSELWTLSKLESIDLGGNGGITGSIPSAITNLINLELLGLWGNQLSGILPSNLGEVSTLKYLYISDNQISGPIPESFGSLENLEIAYMSRNNFSGILPDTFSSMTQLIELGLNQNQLSGPLPPSLALAPNIDRIWMWGNNFEGCFPQVYIDNLCNISTNDFGLNPFLPFDGDIRQICDNGLPQDFDGDGVCIPQDCDDSDPNVTADTLAPIPVCQNMVLPLGENGLVSLYAGSHLVSTSHIVIDTIIENNDTTYVEILIQDPIDDCTPNEHLLVDFSLDGSNFSTYAGFSCEQLGSHDLLIAVTDYGLNKSMCSITIDVVDNSIPQACPCTEEKMIVNDTVYAPLYSAQMDIMDLGTMIGGNSVKYQAGNSISLNPVFIVPVGHVFEAEIEDCNN